ncbi:flavin reductase family protein [Rhodococcus sp. MSC1_016]|jgi:flavin reductase (DIM6/NTAB) family NADH-FMN oxidoreductase RutF|uniref:flavin reductase family protein n=1 Tax=Rhodococcus sp. MSC1_016 TaxID=2909266 RepID=UPI00202EF80E|nr:flavin reductase family protein [Rhodococcus sp. MSC1_016]
MTAHVDACAPLDDLTAYRHTLGAFPTGITVMTAADGEQRVGVTANSFGSVSLEPPLILWNLKTSSPSLPTFRNSGHFAVHVLAWHQEEICRRFATPLPDKFDGLEVSDGLGQAPLLEGCAARLECALVHEFITGDHVVLIGEVKRYQNLHREPLIFFRGATRWFDQPLVS